jgi:hypothetical protein
VATVGPTIVRGRVDDFFFVREWLRPVLERRAAVVVAAVATGRGTRVVPT